MGIVSWLMSNKHTFVMLSPSKPWCVVCGRPESDPEHS